MFTRKYPLMSPDADLGDASAATALGDDHVDEGHAAPENPPAEAPVTEPVAADAAPAPTAEDAVRKALKAEEAPVEEAAAPEQKAPEQPPPEDPKAKLEEIYQIPPGLNREARARFKALSDHARGLDTQVSETKQQYEQVSQKLNGFEAILQDAGATPEILSGHLQYIRACKTGDLESALAFIEQERTAIARALGRPLDGVDVLGDFPDLRAAVDNMEVTEQHAQEIARHRRAQAQQHQAEQQHQASMVERQRAEQYQASVNQARAAIDGWVSEQARSLDWPAIEPAIVAYIQGAAETLRNLPPEQWLSNIKAHYASLATIASRTPPPNPNAPRPLRPQGAGGGVQAPPGSAEEAVKRVLMRR